MNKVHLETLEGRTTFRPGDAVEGVAGWELEAPPKLVEVRLFWHTAGKGDTDVQIVEAVRFDDAPAVDARIYRFTLPGDGPYSFSGRLITLQWSIELVTKPGKEVAKLDLTLSPTGEEVRL